MQPNNGILIKTWISDPEDDCLLVLTGLLKSLIQNGIDVPQFLTSQDKNLMNQIGYGSPPVEKFQLPSQMGAIDELSSHESDEADILPPSCAP